MPPVYVIQQGAKLRIQNRRLHIEQTEGDQTTVLTQLPLGHVSQVVLFGNIGLTTPAIGMLLQSDIEVIFLSLDGDYRGRLTAGLTPHVPLRRAQYRSLDRPDFTLTMAKGFVLAKLQHQRALLLRHNRELQNANIAADASQIASAMAEVPRKTALSSLRGLEGSATAAYFGGYRRLFDPVWQFTSRRRRPPPDPVNVLLSLGYTLLSQAAASAVHTVGLDPYAGYLHEVVYNRAALGLDVVEEFRPVIDGLVLWACRGNQISPSDFTPGPAERPVVLSEEGKRVFLQAFEKRMQMRFTHPISGLKLMLRQCMVEQARQIAARIQENRPGYQGMGFR